MREASYKTAKQLLSLGVDKHIIAISTELSIEEIDNLN
jgi:hypothetical protein